MSVRWAVDVADWEVGSAHWQRLLRQLPAREQEKVARFMFAKDQKLALASCVLQRQLVRELFHLDFASVEIARTPENKPYWKRPPSFNSTLAAWNFNVSHHGTIVAIASEPHALVGVDVVQLSDRPHRKTSIDDFFRAFTGHFNHSEWAYIRLAASQDEQYTRFYRLWSLKESYIKAVGIGLGFSLLRAEFFREGPEQDEIWHLRLDGELAKDWQFTSTQINETHLASVALGPLTALWKPETSSIFPHLSHPDGLLSAGSTAGSTDVGSVNWREWKLENLLQEHDQG